MNDTSKHEESADSNGVKKADADELPDGSSSDGSDDTDRDTASGGPAD